MKTVKKCTSCKRARRVCFKLAAYHIDLVTAFAANHPATPPVIRFAAACVRNHVDLDALELVREWLSRAPIRVPTRVGAASWELGGNVEYTLRRHVDTVRRELKARTA